MTLSQLAAPSKKIVIKVNNNEYETSYPNTGQLIDIDVIKLQMSSGRYDVMKYSLDPSMQQNALRIDVIATFNVLIPKLRQDLTNNKRTLAELPHEQFQIIQDAYNEQFLPWFEQWNTILNTPVKEEQKDEQ